MDQETDRQSILLISGVPKNATLSNKNFLSCKKAIICQSSIKEDPCRLSGLHMAMPSFWCVASCSDAIFLFIPNLVLESCLSCCAVPKYEVLFLTSGTLLWDKGTFFWDTRYLDILKAKHGKRTMLLLFATVLIDKLSHLVVGQASFCDFYHWKLSYF